MSIALIPIYPNNKICVTETEIIELNRIKKIDKNYKDSINYCNNTNIINTSFKKDLYKVINVGDVLKK